MGGTPSHHPSPDGIFPNKNHPAIGVPPWLWTPPIQCGFFRFHCCLWNCYYWLKPIFRDFLGWKDGIQAKGEQRTMLPHASTCFHMLPLLWWAPWLQPCSSPFHEKHTHLLWMFLWFWVYYCSHFHQCVFPTCYCECYCDYYYLLLLLLLLP